MQYCAECKVNISTETNQCPLCHNSLPDAANKGNPPFPDFQRVNKKSSKRIKVLSISIVAIVLIAMSVTINIATWNGNLWSIIFSSYVLYDWLVGLLSYKKNAHLGLKLMVHAIAMSLLLLVVNTFADSIKTINQISWAVSYAMPIIFICFIIIISIIMIIQRQNRRDFLLYQFSLCVIGFAPLVLVLCGVAQPMEPSIAAAGISFFTIIGVILFAKRIIKSELVRKFHI